MVELSYEIPPQPNNEEHARWGRATRRAQGSEEADEQNKGGQQACQVGEKGQEEGQTGNAVSAWVVKSLEFHGKGSVYTFVV